MKVNHELINISALSRLTGIKKSTLRSRLESHKNTFTKEELDKIKAIYEDLFCYLFELDDMFLTEFDLGQDKMCLKNEINSDS